jgi:hypothetical protein
MLPAHWYLILTDAVESISTVGVSVDVPAILGTNIQVDCQHRSWCSVVHKLMCKHMLTSYY